MVCLRRSLYWHIGRHNFGPNSVNIGAALFMWCAFCHSTRLTKTAIPKEL